MFILGISAYYHDSAAALINNGEVIAAAQEERFTRKRHDAAFPTRSIEYCLKQAGVRLDQIDATCFYDKPFLKFDRILDTYLAFAPRGFKSFSMSMPIWIKEKLFLKKEILDALRKINDGEKYQGQLLFSEHHLSHAGSAFYPSPFDEAVIITLDGVGEWATTSVSLGKKNNLEIYKEIHFPHSLGLLYSAMTYYCGFKVNSGEYKVMGLAPYGEPKYAQTIMDHLIDLRPDGSFKLDMSYFDYCVGLVMTNRRFHDLFGDKPHTPEAPLTQKHMDLAASIQKVIEEAVMTLARAVKEETGMQNLCLAGGVALNCVANGRLQRENVFKHVWIQPAAGDAGGALGAALVAYHRYFGQDRVLSSQLDGMKGTYLGPSFSQTEIEDELKRAGAVFQVHLQDEDIIDACVTDLEDGKAIGWFQGRMEFGPRSLGARSIIADARSQEMQATLNLKVKFRESFRPFAPAVLAEEVSKWFGLNTPSPYMLLVYNVNKEHCLPTPDGYDSLFGIEKLNVPRSSIPAVTHVDYSARVQTVHKETNPKFHKLLSRFHEKTECAVVVNTSFNVRGEPIVCTPTDAFRCFMGTDLDRLVIGNCYLRKSDQRADLKSEYFQTFELD